MGFQYDEAALLRFEAALAEGVHDWASQDAAPTVSRLAPRGDGRRDKRKWPVPYHRTIHATTFHRNRIVGGRAVRGRDVRSKAEIWTLIWTGDARGVWLERGTRPHGLAPRDAVIDMSPGGGLPPKKHPGSSRRPHLGIGIFAASRSIGPRMKASLQARLGVR